MVATLPGVPYGPLPAAARAAQALLQPPRLVVIHDTSVRELPLTRGQVALVDAEDYDRCVVRGSWQLRLAKHTMYATRWMTRNGRNVAEQLHAFLTGWPLVDHINGNGLDNRRCNLRPANYSQNGGNRRVHKATLSGFKGVTLHAQSGRWRARINAGDRLRSLGLYADPAEAARAYDRAATEVFGEYALLNFPEAN